MCYQGGDKAARGALVEEFLQCDGKWLESSIVINHRMTVGQRRRGEYRLMSRQDTELNFMCCYSVCTHVQCAGTIHIYPPIYKPEDLLDKYHGDTETVDGIIADKVACLRYIKVGDHILQLQGYIYLTPKP